MPAMPRTGSTASCSRRPARSTPAPTRSSATSLPSACSDYRGRKPNMDFTFEDQQLAFRDAIHKFLMVEAAPEMLRERWETTRTGRSAELRAKLADQGLTARSVPEAFGGIGLGDVDWAVGSAACREREGKNV